MPANIVKVPHDEGPTVSIARMPAQIIPKSIATPRLLAHILRHPMINIDETTLKVIKESKKPTSYSGSSKEVRRINPGN